MFVVAAGIAFAAEFVAGKAVVGQPAVAFLMLSDYTTAGSDTEQQLHLEVAAKHMEFDAIVASADSAVVAKGTVGVAVGRHSGSDTLYLLAEMARRSVALDRCRGLIAGSEKTAVLPLDESSPTVVSTIVGYYCVAFAYSCLVRTDSLDSSAAEDLHTLVVAVVVGNLYSSGHLHQWSLRAAVGHQSEDSPRSRDLNSAVGTESEPVSGSVEVEVPPSSQEDCRSCSN